MSQAEYACPHCGAPIQAGQIACNYCGLALAAQPAPEHQNQARFQPPMRAPGAYPASQQKRKGPLPWVLAIVVVVVLCCGGSAIFAVITGFQLFGSISKDSTETQKIVTQFMQAGAANDPDAAWALFSRSSGADRESIGLLFADHADYFSGFGSVDVRNFSIITSNNGTTATLAGSAKYSAHKDVPFSARLIKEAEVWKLISIQFGEGVGE